MTVAIARVAAAEADFRRIAPILSEHCLDCHAAQDPEADFVMESFETLMKGGESGPAIVPGNSGESLLVRMIEGTFEKDGKKKIMPPGKRTKLTAEQIADLRAWIDSGAKAPTNARIASKEINVPRITPKGIPRKQINAIASVPGKPIFAIARYNEIEIRSSENRALIRTLTGNKGPVNGLAFSADGTRLFSAGGDGGLPGEVREWNVTDGMLLRSYEGHSDAVYGIAISPDGKFLATGSYDQKIKIWDTGSAKEIRTLTGHNGCVYALAFRADGKILASASGDRTVKLWDVANGERRDTLSQSLKELYTVAFSPDGKHLVAGGVDNRIRLWEISESASETTNPLLLAKFGHEGAILKLTFSPDGKTLASSADDRTVKLWNVPDLSEKIALPQQSDWSPAVSFLLENKAVAVGNLDGTYEIYDAETAKPVPLPKPELVRIEPRGVQRGLQTRVKLLGKNLNGVTNLNFGKESFTVVLDESTRADELWAMITPSGELARAGYDISVLSAQGESGKLKIYVDDIPQISSTDAALNPLKFPLAVWGVHTKPGDLEKFQLVAKAGQTLVFDFAAKSMGSKSDGVLTLSDVNGRVLASNNGFDNSTDPFLAYTFSSGGTYTLQVSEQLMAGSSDHFYRLIAGELPYVTASYPFSLGTNLESEVELIGANLSMGQKVQVKTAGAGEMDLPLDSNKFRTRRALKLKVSDLPQQLELEPNDLLGNATSFQTPGAVAGRFWSQNQSSDTDLFAFDAKVGENWIIETEAAQRGSPADTRIEILDEAGRPIERVLLQAMRNSAITFRGIDSNTTDCRVDNWEEMELNEYLYLQGEVVRLFRAPQGPDSGFLFYALNGKRRCYFDTSAATHAVEEPCYIVEPKPPGAKLPLNGLPSFTLNYANDDDGERKLGTDSKLYFSAPRDGRYLIRVTDTRGFSGDRFVYRLIARKAQPDFRVNLSANANIEAGSGQSFTISTERLDGFEGEIKIEISGLPPGFFASTPLAIEAGQTSASGVIYCSLDASEPTPTNAQSAKIVATAMIGEKPVRHEANNFGMIRRGGKPKLFVNFEPDSTSAVAQGQTPGDQPLEITIVPGETVPAWLRIKRNGYEDLVTFTVENLPHGVIVDNIGLNGVLIPKDQNERELFLKAARWVPECDRLCYAVENQAGRQTSRPVLLHVKRTRRAAAAP